jgi:integrase
LPVSAVDDGLVLRALKHENFWYDKPETASRVRGRIEAVLDWARVHGYRSGENPARWKGHLDHLLPARSKLQRTKHHAALPYTEIGAFMTALRESSDLSARALELVILTATRTSEATGARWDEIDFAAKTWTIPAERMKGRKEHRVPLSAPAVALLERLHERRIGEFVFPGSKPGRALTRMAMPYLLQRMGRGDVTVHGFRSTFRDWAGEVTHHPNHVVEQALAHAIGSAVEAAYRRGDLFEKRRLLMDEWAAYCAAPRGEVVEFKGRRRRG